MRFTRTYPGNGLVLSFQQVVDHLRVWHGDLSAQDCADAAGREIEDYCGLALLVRTVTVTTDRWPGRVVALPIGPVQADATATVSVLELDGSETAVASGFWLEGGRYSRLHFETEPGGRLRIADAAGFGTDAYDIPADLRHAIADQAARLYDMRGAEDGKPHAFTRCGTDRRALAEGADRWLIWSQYRDFRSAVIPGGDFRAFAFNRFGLVPSAL